MWLTLLTCHVFAITFATVDVKIGNIYGPDIDADAVQVSLELAAKEIFDTDNLVNISFLHGASHCDVHTSTVLAHKFYHEEKMNAYIGPLCAEEMEIIGVFAAAFHIPILGYVSPGNKFSNKRKYSSLARVSYTSDQFAHASMAAVHEFGWKKIGLIVDYDYPCDTFTDAMYELAEHSEVAIQSSKIDDDDDDDDDEEEEGEEEENDEDGDEDHASGKEEDDDDDDDDDDHGEGTVEEDDEEDEEHEDEHDDDDDDEGPRLEDPDAPNNEATREALESMKDKARVIFACMGSGLAGARTYLLQAHEAKMMGPEYVHVVVYHDKLFEPLPWEIGDGQDELVKELFSKALLLLPEGYYTASVTELLNRIEDITIKKFNKTRQAFMRRGVHLAMIHDAVKLYGLTIRDCLKDSSCNWQKGESVAKRFQQKNFNGATGRVIMSHTADRLSDYYLASRDSNNYWSPNFKLHVEESTHKSGIPELDVEWTMLPELYYNWRTENNHIPLDSPKCGWHNEKCHVVDESYLVELVVAFVVILAVVFVLLILAVKHRTNAYERDLLSKSWIISASDLADIASRPMSNLSLISEKTLDEAQLQKLLQYKAVMGTTAVLINSYKIEENPNIEDAKKEIQILLHEMKQMNHDNVSEFIGICTQQRVIKVVWEYCQKESLDKIVFNEEIQLDMHFKVSIVRDLVKGLFYLHNTKVGCHGALILRNCHIDSRWVVKLTNIGIDEVFRGYYLKDKVLFENRFTDTDLIQLAPEVLRTFDPDNGPTEAPAAESDIYGLSYIIYQVMFREKPFNAHQLSNEETLVRLKTPINYIIRPILPERKKDYPAEVIALFPICWSEDPEQRTNISRIKNVIFAATESIYSGSLIDHMILTMEQYAKNLEQMVDSRTKALVEERQRSDELLNKMLPPSIAEALKKGLSISPESFESATIMFADICGFTTICAVSSPLQIVTMLNDLYSKFDQISQSLDVYKVETIGDAYLVASGLPIRNGAKHVTEIANLAVSYRENVRTYEIPHIKDQTLQVRIGIHSGSVAAGVVGLSMPHYCVFGDTVNMASRLESTGMPMKIQVSTNTMILLKKFGEYDLIHRGTVAIKGKGSFETYWLEKTDGWVFGDEIVPS